MRFGTLRRLVRTYRWLHGLWHYGSGQWSWLDEEILDVTALNKMLWRDSVPSMAFFVMLVLSGIIATVGLLSSSTATVIGAMIIAPLMGPIVGVSYGFALGNRRLIRRAFLTLAQGAIATVLTAIFVCKVTGLETVTAEILARTEPTLIDFMVAVSAGAAGAYAKLNPRVANAFPGVAISVALVPPLSVLGIGIAFGNSVLWGGAATLWFANLAGIVLSGVLVFLWQGHGSLRRAKGGLIFSLALAIAISMPLAISFRQLRFQSQNRQMVRRTVEALLVATSENLDVRKIVLQTRGDRLFVEVEIGIDDPDKIDPARVREIQTELQRTLNRSVTLEVTALQVRRLVAPPAGGTL
ncbi:MAG: DUF389 domain-containing protein [Geitlerinemataceae cyanobacterium]